jgi:hypothetical protein
MTPAIAVRFPGSANNSIETRLSNREPQMTILSPVTGQWFRRRFGNCRPAACSVAKQGQKTGSHDQNQRKLQRESGNDGYRERL